MRKILLYLTAPMAMYASMAIGAMSNDTGHDAHYRDYVSMEVAATGKLREYMKANPEYSLDSLRRHVIENISDGSVGKAADLLKPRTKKLTSEKIYELCSKSSLIYGKMERNKAFNTDTVYKNASAVVLTPDGVCATNYHVVSDIVLGGGIGLTKPDDYMRFVMDYDGNVYPMTGILAVDPVNDWAIIKVDPCGHKLTPASIGGDVPIGTNVYCLASPSGAYFHFTDGMVSNCVRTIDRRSGQVRYDLEITSDYGVGASGGPIFDDCGNLVGLVSSTVSLYAQPEQNRNFQMAYKQTVPVFLIKERFND